VHGPQAGGSPGQPSAAALCAAANAALVPRALATRDHIFLTGTASCAALYWAQLAALALSGCAAPAPQAAGHSPPSTAPALSKAPGALDPVTCTASKRRAASAAAGRGVPLPCMQSSRARHAPGQACKHPARTGSASAPPGAATLCCGARSAHSGQLPALCIVAALALGAWAAAAASVDACSRGLPRALDSVLHTLHVAG